MKIAVTGGTGFIGKWFLRTFGDKHDCTVLGIESDITEFVVNEKPFKFIRTDFTYEELLKHLKPAEAVIHLAGLRPARHLVTFEDFYENIRISENLFRACAQLGIGNIAFASTGSIYSPAVNRLPFSENQAVSPPSFYAISKLTIENLGPCYGLRIKSLRFAHVVGLGEREGYMLTTFINRARRREPLIVFGQGKGQREYIYVKDVASALIAALLKTDVEGVFNIGMGRLISHRQFAENIADVFSDGQIDIVMDSCKIEDTATYLMDGSKTQNILGWKPEYSLPQALSEMKEVRKNT